MAGPAFAPILSQTIPRSRSAQDEAAILLQVLDQLRGGRFAARIAVQGQHHGPDLPGKPGGACAGPNQRDDLCWMEPARQQSTAVEWALHQHDPGTQPGGLVAEPAVWPGFEPAPGCAWLLQESLVLSLGHARPPTREAAPAKTQARTAIRPEHPCGEDHAVAPPGRYAQLGIPPIDWWTLIDAQTY